MIPAGATGGELSDFLPSHSEDQLQRLLYILLVEAGAFLTVLLAHV